MSKFNAAMASTRFSEQLDPKHRNLKFWTFFMAHKIWSEKYAQPEDNLFSDSCERVVRGIYAKDPNVEEAVKAYEAMLAGLWMPAGRIWAGAGTDKRVTLMNCYVTGTIEDSMEGIMQELNNFAFTMQQGGGDGADFSTIRPEGAMLFRTRTKASGPIPFMHTWDAMCTTIRSAGDRRGAMMGVLSDSHPDLPKFIVSKREPGKLTNFNISVLVSDAFMEAIQDDADWYLYFNVPQWNHPSVVGEERSKELGYDETLAQYDFEDDDGKKQYVYSVWKARDLWKMITENTYEYSEPGVIFIDRINELNNLWYCEEIRCTNPCVTGDTLILTSKGYKPIKDLVGKKITVWTGSEWCETEPFSTGVNDTFSVKFNNGATVRTTAAHKWLMRDGKTRLTTNQLAAGSELAYNEFPVLLDGIKYEIDAYSQGFYSGDGTKNSDVSNLYKHGKGIQDRLVGKFWDRNCVAQPGVRWVHGSMWAKDFVPVYGTAEYCVNWLAGLLDADGNIARPNKDAMPVLQLNAKDRKFLEQIRIMLTRLGVNARFWERKDAGTKYGSNGRTYMAESTACLMISGKGAYQLQQLGLKCERVDLSWVRKPNGIARKGVKVISVTPATTEETFCMTVTKGNTFIANGVITGNCGEQPLPPHGTCNLGHVNLARMVKNPFTEHASFNYQLLAAVVRIGVRFLDNVIDVTNYPLTDQMAEQENKRRIGLGFTGLADVFAQMQVRYGSKRSADIAEKIMQIISEESYLGSVELAKERGSFPLLDTEKYLGGNNFAAIRLPKHVQDAIRKHGIRNSVLNTIAPTGTSSLMYGNPGAGLEPIFAHHIRRNIRQDDGVTFKPFDDWGYSAQLYHVIHNVKEENKSDLPAYMNTMADLDIHDHILIQSVVQRWVDASVSKTVNIDTNKEFDDFVQVYDMAYKGGCKGCTTYRPSDIRGSILLDASAKTDESGGFSKNASTGLVGNSPIRVRSSVLEGKTYKLKWPSRESAVYFTINHDEEGQPFEVFIISKDGTSAEWTTALSLMITALFRKGGDFNFIANELKQIQAVRDSAWIPGVGFVGSLPAYIGHVIETHMQELFGNVSESDVANLMSPSKDVAGIKEAALNGMVCEKCHAPSVFKSEGCLKCVNCGNTKCG